MNPSQKKHLLILVLILAVLVIVLLLVRSAKERSARQAEEEAAAEEAAGVITEEAAYSALSYDNGTTALSFALDEEGNVADISRLERREVTLGRNNDDYIEIVDGLEEGDVVLAPSPQGSSMMQTMMELS